MKTTLDTWAKQRFDPPNGSRLSAKSGAERIEMAYVRMPPPSVEQMLEQFADWMAQHAQAKITVRIEYRDGTYQTSEIDHRGPMPKTVPPNAALTGAEGVRVEGTVMQRKD